MLVCFSRPEVEGAMLMLMPVMCPTLALVSTLERVGDAPRRDAVALSL